MMNNKNTCYLFAFLVAAVLAAPGCGKQTQPSAVQESAPVNEIVSQPSASVQSEETIQTAPDSTAGETQTDISGNTEGQYRGVVMDAAMHSILIQTENGESRLFSYPEEKPDISGLGADGIIIGMGVELTVDDENHVSVIKSIPTEADDTDALETVAELVLAANSDDFNDFKLYTDFPVKSGKKEIDEAGFTEDIFWTPQIKHMLSTLNLLALKKTGDSIVIQKSESTPSITVSLIDNGWYVTSVEP